MKPSQRIEELHKALKILDGQNPEDKNFGMSSFETLAILKYLDEKEEGTEIEKRKNLH